ncbi:MAG: BadF/BadG/BcrA/BcrD ATPase family protein [Bryobacteraceae bacterium]
MSELFLGVDGGQSSTTALVGDSSGRVIGYGRGGPCNHVSGPGAREKFLDAVGGCVRAALAGAPAHFRAARFGFSGGAEDKQALLDEILTADDRLVTHDAMIALEGATAGEPGIIVIAGTGSIAFGRNAGGRTARAGGWGHVFGDEGGGFDIARMALRAALKMEEGWGPATALHELLLAETGAPDANTLMHWFYTDAFPRARVAAYAKLVDRAATKGDTVAHEILNTAAASLGEFAEAVRKQLFVDHEPARVSWIGGVFRSELLRHRFQSLVEMTDGNMAGPPLMAPAAGALLDAYRLAGLRVTLENLPVEEKE